MALLAAKSVRLFVCQPVILLDGREASPWRVYPANHPGNQQHSNIQRSLSIHTITGWRNIHVAVGGSSPVHRESAILTREGLEIRTFSSSMGSVHWSKVSWFDSSSTSDRLFCFGSEEQIVKMSCQAQCRHLRAVLITRVKTDN